MDFFQSIKILWVYKWTIGAVSFTCAAIAAAVSLLIPDIYRSEAVLAPNSQESAGVLPALVGQYSGLAGLVGLNLDGMGADKTVYGLGVLKSRKFLSEFIDRHDLLVPLMAASGWDEKTRVLSYDKSLYDSNNGKWVRNVSPPKTSVPSTQEAYEEFLDRFFVSQDRQTGFITVAIEHYSPVIAKEWVDLLVRDLNSTIMSEDVDAAKQAIAFLNEQIQATSLAEMHKLLFDLIAEQTRVVMLAQVTDEYLFKTLDPAFEQEEAERPKRLLIVFLAVMGGAGLAVLIVILRGRWVDRGDS